MKLKHERPDDVALIVTDANGVETQTTWGELRWTMGAMKGIDVLRFYRRVVMDGGSSKINFGRTVRRAEEA